MDSLISWFVKRFDEGEHYKIMEIVYLMFSLIAPSFCFIFLYKRHIFNELNVFKLLLLCIISNFILMFCFYGVAYIRNELKSKIKKEKSNLLVKECSIIETRVATIIITLYMLLIYIQNIIIRSSSNIFDNMMYTLFFIILLFLVYFIDILKKAIKIKSVAEILLSTLFLIYCIRLIYFIIKPIIIK